MMPAAPVAAPVPNSIPMQHTQYAPQQQNNVQGTTYQPAQQQQQRYVGAPAAPVGAMSQQQQPVAQPVGAPVAPAPGQPQQQQAAQIYPHQGLNGGWQSDQDYSERRKMIAKIVHLLKLRKPNAPQDWLKKLPQMAKRLEESLYRSAKSFDEYNDGNTLKQRLQQLAHSIGMKTKRIQQAQMQARAQQQQQQHQQPQQQMGQQGMQYRAVPQQPQQQGIPQQQQPIAPLQQQQQAPLQQIQQAPMVQGQHQPMQQPPPVQQPQGNNSRIVNVAEINPIMSQPTVKPTHAPVQPAPMHYQPAQPQAPVPAPQQQVSAPVQGQPPAQNGAGNRQVSDRQQVLRHQQQRLLLLRHAAKCQHGDGRCPVTPHCAGMKRLWKHIAECKDQKCLVPHCVSSRYVLSHYHRCKDVRCPVCGPVREAIHRSHEKQKQMQALKQRHDQALQQNQNEGVPVGAPAPVGAPQPVAPAPGQPIAPRNMYQPAPGNVPAPAGVLPPQPISSQPPTVRSFPPKQQPMPQQPGVPAAPVPQAKANVPPVDGVKFANGQVITPKFTGPKPQEDHTLINCFSVEQIETHIASLNKGLQLPAAKLKTSCLDVLKVLQAHQHGWVFNSPVDPVELGLPDYFEVIKQPMDLGTIRKKLENGCYHSLDDFHNHVQITFDNAMLYNPEGSVVYNMAHEMKTKFIQDFDNLMKQLNAEEDAKRRNGEACSLCGCEKLLFEPPVFYCNGLNCPSKRIRRNSYYYVGGNNQYHWCHQCWGDLKEGQTLELADVSIRKEQLVKKKNDETHEESWVQCDRCERWVHQICALFNTRQNKDQRSEFACPRCTIEERKKTERLEATSSTPMAEDLQRTKLSEFIESHVRNKMDEHLRDLAEEKVQKDGMALEEAKASVTMGGAITIRQVTSMDRKLEVRERMKKRYAFKKYPDEFTYRCKCFIVFQNLDGVDVILFGLYVYEHDEKNPAPNNRTVYVSYLDSVHYMRPRSMRTFIYHEILISYLDYVRRRGFSTAHIWACPPLKGDDYILYAKPEDQKTPKDDRLRQWYIDMLVDCQKRGIVGKLTNMYDLYFSNKEKDATIVPYMEGDYFPAEVENIIKDIEEGKVGKKKSGGKEGKKKKGDKKQKRKSGRGGTRSSGIDEDALKASGVQFPGDDQKSLEEGGRDYVMVKLGETIQPMKESFIVAFLSWKGAKKENMVVPKAIQEYREKHNIVIEDGPEEGYHDPAEEKEKEISEEKSNDIAMTDSSDKKDTAKDDGVTKANSSIKMEDNKSEPSVEKKPEENVSVVNNSTKGEGKNDGSGKNKIKMEEQSKSSNTQQVNALTSAKPVTSQNGGSNTTAPLSATNTSMEKTVGNKSTLSMEERSGKFAAMAKKRGISGEEKNDTENKDGKEKTKAKGTEKEAEAAPVTYVLDSKGRRVKVIDDDAEEMDCEFLNNRQAFLNLCQGNHYQFDHLRRAKHSSMMVLWHLHNRDAPKFVQQCTTCSREILSGFRFHCSICADFDQCQECVQSPNLPRHPHQLKAIAVSGQQTELTEAQRKERQRSIQLHMTLLQHAATCSNPKCPSANCTKMKGLLKHGAQCTVKANGGCNVCKRIWALLQIHARQCKASQCPVPNCMAIRERVRQLKKQQQAMDDRRRQEMNRVYRGAR
eukprot:jgi/Psemu1/247266/estExt_Genewise1.C_10040019